MTLLFKSSESLLLSGPKPSRLILASDVGDKYFESIGHMVSPFPLVDVLFDPVDRVLLGAIYPFIDGEPPDQTAWYAAARNALGGEVVTLEPPRWNRQPELQDLRTTGLPGENPDALAVRWARSPTEIAEIVQLPAAWLARLDAEEHGGEDLAGLGLFAFVLFDVAALLEQMELAFPTELLVDEVIDLRGREHELRSFVLGR